MLQSVERTGPAARAQARRTMLRTSNRGPSGQGGRPRFRPDRLFSLAILSGIGAVPLLMAAGPRQQAEGEASDEIRELVEDLLATREERRALEASLEAERQALGADVARLMDDLQLERARAERSSATEQGLRSRADSARVEATRIASAIEAIARDVQSTTRELRERLESGVPFQREQRVERLTAIEVGLGGEEADRARALVELLTVLGEELHLAESIEQRSDRVTLSDGRRLHAYVVRVGLLRSVFISEDGSTVGISDDAGSWRTELDDGVRAAIVTLVATARGKQAPALVGIPLGGPPR